EERDRVRVDLIKRFWNRTDDDAVVAPLREIRPNTVDPADIGPVLQTALTLFHRPRVALTVGDESRINTRERVQQEERLSEFVPIEMLHHGAAQETEVDTALHEIAL